MPPRTISHRSRLLVVGDAVEERHVGPTPNKRPLGRLVEVDLREQWENEASAFTPWLAEQDNLRLLGEALGKDLELKGREAPVGAFSADLLCKDTSSDSIVLIENQLEKTDHRHLGQILTYAAGLDAETLVWVASTFTEEHRAAIDWFNRVTHDRIQFFGVVVQLLRIEGSLSAPRFEVVAKPNGWSRVARESVNAGPSTPAQQLLVRYWSGLGKLLGEFGSRIRRATPSNESVWSFSLGRSDVKLRAVTSARDHRVAVEVYLFGERANERFAHLHAQCAEIEKELGETLVWDQREGTGPCSILLQRDANPDDETTWPELHEWTRMKLEALDRAFRNRVQALS
jgi:hypothetical protein